MTINEISRRNPIQASVTTAAFAAAIALIGLAYFHGATKLAIASVIGLFAGVSLYHASFGFTAAWRPGRSHARLLAAFSLSA